MLEMLAACSKVLTSLTVEKSGSTIALSWDTRAGQFSSGPCTSVASALQLWGRTVEERVVSASESYVTLEAFLTRTSVRRLRRHL